MNKWLISTLLLSLASSMLMADDTEIYVGNPSQNTIKPNIVFIFDTSGSMADKVSGTTKTRLELVKQAALDVIGNANDDKRLQGVNLAIMRYNPQRSYFESGQDKQYRGGYLVTKMLDVDNGSNRTTIRDTIDDLPANGGTPMTEAVHEAYNFLTGAAINYGKTKSNSKNSWTYLGKTGDVRDGNNYKSPITEQCQKNHIVLFTDGDSSVDGESNEQIRSWLSGLPDRPSDLSTSCTSNGGGNTTITNSCIEELAYVMYNREVKLTLNGEQVPIQPIKFHAIGGFLEGNSQTFLDNAAFHGGKGVAAAASNYAQLKKALEDVFGGIIQSNGTFAAPAVSVNAFNSLEQLDQLYYSVFQPQENVGWSGNVKRFRMSGGKIVDQKGDAAVDETTGFFRETAHSFWTKDADAPDGDKITQGGMASRLDVPRKIYSNLVSNNLVNNDNLIKTSNGNITAAVMGTSLTGDSFKKLVQWVGGYDSKSGDGTKARYSMEDLLHSAPVLLNYGELSINGKKVPDSTLYVGTNSGYLHAFDTHETSPKERFAFIPKELLPVATQYYVGTGSKAYGLDGHISVWHQDTNKDMIVNSGEKAYLYVGMRRGGSSYYALDVSNRDNPKLLWQINGKNHQNGPTTGFEELGQTWSKMLPVDIKWNGVKTKALIFAGGYDIVEDSKLTRQAHSVGNASYMVNAKTGALLWKASKTGANLNIADMKSAIVGDVVPVDDNSDGFVDLLHVADLGGRIFRIDFDNNATTANSYATGGMIADLGRDSSQSEHVRFYTTLDVVYSKAFSYVESTDTGTNMVNGKPRYVLSIGSGYRAHPLDNSATDHFYVLFDYNTEGPALGSDGKPTYSSITRSQLQKFTLTDSGKAITPSLATNNGFYVELINAGNSKGGEKVLSDSITLDNTIYFTTFRPSSGTMSSSCTADTGQSRLYKLSLKPGVSSLAVEDINIPGIAPKPVVLMPKAPKDGDDEVDTSPKLLISTQIFDTENSEFPLKKTYWRELKQ